MLIGIDPGHGGKDPGAVGLNGLFEKDVTLAISKALGLMLRAGGVDSFMTRTGDTREELITRTALINNVKCDLAVSIHCNASENRAANYIATYIQATGGEAEKMAKKVQAQLVLATGWPDGGVKVQNLALTRDTKMPAILCECGFISNPEQEAELSTPVMQRKLAVAIARGILDYIGIGEVTSEMNVDQALEILKEKCIISNTEYWGMAAKCVQYLSNFIIAVANYVK
jgi:N-acetylmuramoyl-L-alanine amidase